MPASGVAYSLIKGISFCYIPGKILCSPACIEQYDLDDGVGGGEHYQHNKIWKRDIF